MLKLISWIQTCWGCPSQWEGKLADGRMIYFRYRWGHLSVSISEEPTYDVMDAVGGEQIVGHDFERGEWDGFCEEHEVIEACLHIIDFSNMEIPE